MESKTKQPIASSGVDGDRDLISKAKDLAAQKHGYRREYNKLLPVYRKLGKKYDSLQKSLSIKK